MHLFYYSSFYGIFVVLILVTTRVCGQLHFASLGNWGSGTSTQKDVANTLKQQKISFVLSPGSNFVSGKVVSIEDDLWNTSFSQPYNGLYLPFFTVLGSSDWQGNSSAFVLKSMDDYTSPSSLTIPKFTLPNYWYHHILHFQDASGINPTSASSDVSLAFVFVDTYILSDEFLYPNITKLHWDSLRDTVESVVKISDWIVVVGDKALLSSGSSKGNASLRRTLGSFLKDHKVDIYISGNDNDMEIIKDGNLTYINCGSGSRGQRIKSKVNGSIAYSDKPGFCHHTVTKNYLTTEFINGATGDQLFNHTQSQLLRPRSWLSRFNIYKELPEITFIQIPTVGTGGERPGPGGIPTHPPQPGDIFIAFIGTLGLLVMGFVAFTGIGTAISKAVKSL